MKQGRTTAKCLQRPKAQKEGRAVLTAGLVEQFADFVEYHSARDFSINMRKMLLEFLMQERAMESVYLKDLLYHIDGLFDLLDAIDREAPHGGQGLGNGGFD